MAHMLIVEDDLEIQHALTTFLTATGHSVVTAEDGLTATSRFDESIQFVLLDILLPKLDGFGVCQHIRKTSDVPIVMLTALGSEYEQLRAFDLRIDDYITKPFSAPILLRKIEAILRRTLPSERAQCIQYGALSIDLIGMAVAVDGAPVELTAKEFSIVLELFSHLGVMFTRDMIFDKIWGVDAFYDDRVINTHMGNIRRKLGVDYIKTVRGVGYKVEAR